MRPMIASARTRVCQSGSVAFEVRKLRAADFPSTMAFLVFT